MAETKAQTNNLAIKFKKRLSLKEAHKRGLVSDKQMAKAKEKESAK